jgi:mRNA interferase MazF
MEGKDFDAWNEVKKSIDRDSAEHLYFKEREVWFFNIGLNVGIERDSRNDQFSRPVVVVKKFNADMFWGVPLSRQIGGDGRFHLTVNFQDENVDATISQMRVYDRKRLRRRIGMLGTDDFARIRAALKACL